MTDSPWLDDRSQRVWRQWLRVTSRLPGTQSAQLMRDSDISQADFAVLVALSEAPEHRLRIAELADMLQWERSRLSHQLTRMGKRGLIRREECAQDGRWAFAVLTADGNTRIVQAAPNHARLVRHLFFDDLPPEDLETFGRVLERINARIDGVRG